MSRDIERLIVLGPPGSYLDGLASSMDLGYPVEYLNDFPSMIAEAKLAPETAILLPIKNTLKGTLSDVVGAFQGGRLMVEAAAKIDVAVNAMGVGTLEDAQSIGGKDEALKQITRFMPHLLRVEMPSTSAAGLHISETGDRTLLSIGSKAQARLYGLNVLAEGIQDADGVNLTTVLMARGRNGWKFDPDTVANKPAVSGTMIFGAGNSDRPGSLYRALGEIADRDINLTNIESLTIRGTEMSEFFVTMSGTGAAIADLATSRQAATHVTIDVLGTYDDPLTYPS